MDEVEVVWLPPMQYVTALRYSDLRHTRWEMYQFPRIIPIIYTGPVDEYIVLPWNITVPQAQDRVDEWSRSNYYMDHIMAIDYRAWILHRIRQCVKTTLTGKYGRGCLQTEID